MSTLKVIAGLTLAVVLGYYAVVELSILRWEYLPW